VALTPSFLTKKLPMAASRPKIATTKGNRAALGPLVANAAPFHERQSAKSRPFPPPSLN